MPVNRGRNREVVDQFDPDQIAFSNANLRSWRLAVVSPNPDTDIVHQLLFEFGGRQREFMGCRPDWSGRTVRDQRSRSSNGCRCDGCRDCARLYQTATRKQPVDQRSSIVRKVLAHWMPLNNPCPCPASLVAARSSATLPPIWRPVTRFARDSVLTIVRTIELSPNQVRMRCQRKMEDNGTSRRGCVDVPGRDC